MKSDIQIARETPIKLIVEIAKQLGINPDDLDLYGKHKAKIPLSYIDEEKIKKSKLILVTAITPTPAGEGKTTTSIGLAMGLNRIGKKATVVLREPSLGPVFGVKGGAAGGGYAQVIPMEDINLHFTGDMAAIEKANNLLSALIDNNLQNTKNNLNLDPRTISWKRVMDMNDRSLRDIVIGLGGTANGIPRETGFNITAASEVMAILCMAADKDDLEKRLGNIFIGFTFDKKPVYARDLNAQGAMAVLLKDAIMPNLVQTLDNTPAIIHGGPFANIAQGTNSIIATKTGLSLSEFVVTEAGFASDLGAEKFFDIKCQAGGLMPNAVVIVATVRALKYHGGAKKEQFSVPDAELVRKGLPNLEKHIENMKMFGFTPVIAINKFDTDSEEEIKVIDDFCKSQNVPMAVNESWAKGSEGAVALAETVISQAKSCPSCFKPLYDKNWDVEKKISTIVTNMYGAKDVEYSLKARKDLQNIVSLGLDKLAVCMAKTQNSLSDIPELRGRPKDFTVNIREIEISSGAGFVVPIAGTIMRMPGLPAIPSAENIGFDDDGNVTGLF
ncbi:MAG: formate--tetrahydrofolate ligase [Bacteroidetes bacterium GWF2_43_63]|nr:MAG: formate--tetrahydrofolate ligase [Bacteroidetes bacterium GWE2_42_42]OFY54732.1 MAG: formate--tetrahydrofolate ligase [Bacteroidetes bacterium GWF2_43_63]HBG69207.1 formate--tetrahydrofolate ligase [Bacteroidales bacterium]HCB62522.1 formate--tetrahydrofolate ligase [Bacteroidales bacterium]